MDADLARSHGVIRATLKQRQHTSDQRCIIVADDIGDEPDDVAQECQRLHLACDEVAVASAVASGLNYGQLQ